MISKLSQGFCHLCTFFKPVQKEEIPHSKFKENQGSGNSKGKYFKKLRFHFSSIMTTYVLLPLLTRKNLS